MFSDREKAYLKSQRLARIATVSAGLQPDVAPVGFEFDGERFFVGGLDLKRTLKFRNVEAGNLKISLVVDDLETVQPWKPRGIKVHGHAEIVERTGQLGRGVYLAIEPERYWSWGIEGPAMVDGKPIIKRGR
ncbi:MAG TPA: PPOX class F420-dependent oxidoreductase [Methylomirabilota bacterium]|nr:PPOX class F420-dependent oxidoreductase [Methylomirabilota bacterium]